MDIVLLLDDIKVRTCALERKIHDSQRNYNMLVNGLVKMHQEARIAKDFKISDALRELLNSTGVVIIQGTAEYKYDEIPKNLEGRFVGDTWRSK